MAFRNYFLFLLKPLGLLLQLNRSVTEFDEFRGLLVANTSSIPFILNGLPRYNVSGLRCTLNRILLRGEYGSSYFLQKRKKGLTRFLEDGNATND
jgi:hypothetical protein